LYVKNINMNGLMEKGIESYPDRFSIQSSKTPVINLVCERDVGKGLQRQKTT
jgi:hypothetical protein